MTKIIQLAPHDAIPEGPGRQIVVLRRFEEERPDQVTVQIILTGKPEQTTHPHNPDGTPMSLKQAVEAAKRVAAEEGIEVVHVLDRMAGERERDVARHGGDHSVHMEGLEDMDLEDGEHGSDMRDRLHSHTP